MSGPGRPAGYNPSGVPDVGESHILIPEQVRGADDLAALLIRVCPAGVYAVGADGTIVVDYPRCLECGACRAVVPPTALRWRYPRGGFGVAYRQG